MLYPIETTKIINHKALLKNEPEIDFAVNRNYFHFDKTGLKNNKVVKPSVVTKLNDDADMKDEGNIEESEDRCEEQQETRRLRRREAEKADLKIKQYH